ncbi:fatty acid-binding protein, brain [Ictalurus furcatus]|uniref:fatty acid-binding protein, brain n=1 Tax=Ictalurus furcatus TaxID=66913 RepID=UPI002350CB35|nr:fatty acid-binding protein, brain [Ictalurus furcatus]
MEAFFASWKTVKSENLDDYLKVIGLNDELRSVANVIKPVFTFSQEDDIVVFKTQTVVNEHESRFTLGEEFDDKALDGRVCKTIITLDGDKLIQVQKWDSKEATAVREIQDGKLIMTLTCDEVTAVIICEKV